MALPLVYSTLARAYFFGPNHPFKMRLFAWVHRLLGLPLFTVGFGQALICLDINDSIQFEILRTGDFEPEVWNCLAEKASQDEVVWDIGSNIGSVALRAAQDPRVSQVHCFEPNPTTLRKLQRNVLLNPQFNMKTYGFALGNQNQSAPLYVGLLHNSGVAGFYPHWSTESVLVDCFTADTLVEQGRCPAPTLIKIDVEGYELKVLQGMQRTLRERPPKAIVFESHLDETGKQVDLSVVQFLESLGWGCRFAADPGDRRTVNMIAERIKA